MNNGFLGLKEKRKVGACLGGIPGEKLYFLYCTPSFFPALVSWRGGGYGRSRQEGEGWPHGS